MFRKPKTCEALVSYLHGLQSSQYQYLIIQNPLGQELHALQSHDSAYQI